MRRDQQQIDANRWRPRRTAIIPLDATAPTTVIAAITALTANRVLTTTSRRTQTTTGSPPPQLITVAPCPDPEIPRLLGAPTAGDLAHLASTIDPTPNEIDGHIDTRTHTGAPLIASNQDLTPDELTRAATHLARRYGGYLIVLTHEVATQLTPATLASVERVLAVTTAATIPDWIYTTTNPLQPFLDTETLAITHTTNTTPTPAGWGIKVPQHQFLPTDLHNLTTHAAGVSLTHAPTPLISNALHTANFLLDATTR